MLTLVVGIAAEYGLRIEEARIKQEQRSHVISKVGQYRASLEAELNATLYLTNGLVAYVATHSKLDSNEAQSMLKILYGQGHHIRNIGLAPGNRLTYVYPLEGNEKAIGLYYPDLPDQWPAVKRAIGERQPRLAGPVHLKQGGVGFIYRVPVFVGTQGNYWGILSMVLDEGGLFEKTGVSPQVDGLQLALRGKDGAGQEGETFLGDAALFATDTVKATITTPGGFWQIAAKPVGGWTAGEHIRWLRAGSWGISILLGLFLFYVLTAIAQRFRAEQAVKLIVDTEPECVKVLAADGTLLQMNRAGLNMIEADSEEQVIGRNVAELVAPEHREAFVELTKRVCQGESGTLEFEVIGLKGGRRWLDTHAAPMRDARGRITGLLGVTRDITDRVIAMDALRKSEERFRHLAEEAPFPLTVTRISDNKLLYINSRTAELFKISPEEAIGGYATSFWVDLEERERFKKELLVSGAVQDCEVKLHDLHGREFWALLSATITTWNGEPVLLTAINDISKRREAEDTLKQFNQNLEQRVAEEAAKNREKDHLMIQQARLAAMGEMISNIAHQWRQPLNALGLLIANIKDAHDYNELDAELLKKYVADGRKYIDKMSSTIDDFRNFFKPNTEKKRFRLCESLTEVMNMVDGSFRSYNVTIINESCDLPCLVEGYQNEFQQVVLNALSNAKEAIVARKIAGKIRLKIEMTGNHAILSILDNGGGVPQEIMSKIFDPYFTTKESGTGIGLYMSKMIMEKMNGEIAICNKEDGAEVRLSVPLG